MVPGLVSHLDIQWQQTGYRRFVRALERGGRLIRLDKRGTGLSDPAAELPTTQERVRDVAARAVRRRAGRDRIRRRLSAAGPGASSVYGTSYRRSAGRAACGGTGRCVRHWGQGQIIDLMAPSLAESAGAPRGRGVRAGGGQPGHGGDPDRVPRTDQRTARPWLARP